MAEAKLTMCHCIQNMSASASSCSRKDREHSIASSCSRSEGVAWINLGIMSSPEVAELGGQPWVWTASWTGGLLSQKHLKAPVAGRRRPCYSLMRRLDCTISNPLKTSNRPDPPDSYYSRLSRVLKLPIIALLPLISNFHKRPVVDDPPAARCALLFALNNCSSTPSLSPSECLLEVVVAVAYFQKVPHFWHWPPGRSFCTSILLYQSSNRPGCDRASLSRNTLDSICPPGVGKGDPQFPSRPGLRPIQNDDRCRLGHGCADTPARPRHQSSNIPNLGSFHLSSLDRTFSNAKYVRPTGRRFPKRTECAENSHRRTTFPQVVSGCETPVFSHIGFL
jgi:hypothetical protein